MSAQSKILSLLEPDYGYVVFVAVDSIFVNMWLAMNVVRARKEYNVKYPVMYSSENGGDNKFNCIQRAHQNTLEAYPGFLMLLLLGGLQYPRVSAGAGALYLLSRIIYARGYSSGDAEKRRYGAFGYAGSLLLIGSTVSLGAHLLGWCGGNVA